MEEVNNTGGSEEQAVSNAAMAATEDEGVGGSAPSQGVEGVGGGSGSAVAAREEGHFWESFSDEGLKGNPNVTKHKSVEALAKSYVELSRKLGSKGLAPLPEDATEEQREARKTLRRGENIKSPSDYSFRVSEEDSQAFNSGSMKTAFNPEAVSSALYDAGLDDEAHSAAMREICALERSRLAMVEKELAEGEQKMRDEWDEDYEVNMKANELFMARRFPEVHETLVATGMYRVPAIARMLKAMNEMTQDGEIRIQRAAEKSFDEQLSALTNSEAYRNAWHPDHDKAVARRTDLIQQMAHRR